MIEFALHPNIYATGSHKGLRAMLEEMWIRSHQIGSGTIYIIAGFANFNGGARFYKTFKEHTELGGSITAILGGSSSQRTSSRQVVEALLECGANVHITNRKSLMHAKCYGLRTDVGEQLVVTSGNFTDPGMAQNVEAALYLDNDATKKMGFQWGSLITQLLEQPWTTHRPRVLLPEHPAWNLLYDETPGILSIDQSEKTTVVAQEYMISCKFVEKSILIY